MELASLTASYDWTICDRLEISQIRVELNWLVLDISGLNVSKLDRTVLAISHGDFVRFVGLTISGLKA